MNMTIWIVLGAAVLLWLFLPRRDKSDRKVSAKKRKMAKSSTAKAKLENPYQAVSLSAVGGACPAVESYGDTRFLVRESPPLPLHDCTSPRCNCHYVRHEDRRQNIQGRRTSIVAGINEFAGELNRRSKEARGRRKSDRTVFA